ncbi:MAG: copper-translocating P-type ATPase [Candidatus Paceibacterota bacterium]
MNCCHTETKEQRNEVQEYTCPMHPEVRTAHQGMCPECGMNLVPATEEKRKHGGHANIFKRKFWISFILTIPVLLYSPLLSDFLSVPTFSYSDLLGPVLGTIVFFYGGWVFIESAWREIRGKLPGMMTLIAIAISAAYVFSMAVVFFGVAAETLFWELTSLITIMLLGHWLEMRAVQGARGALKELSRLLPDVARVQRDDGHVEIPLEELELGDVVLVRPGERIPADGTIITGSSSLDESIITGESRPVEKDSGDEVIAGTINGDGSLEVRVDKIGEDTFLAGVSRLVAEAQASKSRLQILSDRAALYLTIAALSVGIFAFGAWIILGAGIIVAVTRLVTVLVIACPHALGLAVPLVASISTTKAAQNGFLVKERRSLEAARNVSIILFDKTGTLTTGEFGVSDIIADDPEETLRLAASLNFHSEHPIAAAMRRYAEEKDITLSQAHDFKRIPGKGVSGKVEERSLVLGNTALLQDNGVSAPDNSRISTHAQEGKTIVHLVVDGGYKGSIVLGDVVRAESREAVKTLREFGLKSALVTGDSEDVAKWVAEELGIDEYYANVLPAEKARKVRELQERGEKVAMVGDGVNDAPALAQADLGIAIGAGTNVAIESAGIILVRDDPRDVVRVIRLSRLTYTKMVQNIWWAAGYNIVTIPLAAGVLAGVGIVLQPAIGAVLMSISTVIVAFNALLLRRKKV